MLNGQGKIIELYLGGAARLLLPAGLAPQPGQYLQGVHAAEPPAVLSQTLFAGGLDWRVDGDVAANGETLVRFCGPLPPTWDIGDRIRLRGPLGQGFRMPPDTRRLALAAIHTPADRLLPVARMLLEKNGAVAMFSDEELPRLPLEVEAYPLAALPENIGWPDFLAIDLPAEDVPDLRALLGLETGERLSYPAQALVSLPMPCAGQADCGACAVSGKFSEFLACKDGPVFDLSRLSF